MNESKRSEIVDLFNRGIREPAGVQDRERLAELLRNDPQAQAFFVEHCQIHTMLAWEHGTLDSQPFPETRITTPTAPQYHHVDGSARRWRLLAIAASALLVMTATWQIYKLVRPQLRTASASAPTQTFKPQVVAWADRKLVANLTEMRGGSLQLVDLGRKIAAGEGIKAGRYELENGFVELKFTNGIEVVVESPAEIELESAMKMVIHRGRMSARVSADGIGFVVETPSASLVDHGTEFSIDVLDQTGSEIHVFEGAVTVRPKHAPPQTEDLRLTSNQAARIDDKSGIPEGIDVDHDRFIRQLTEGPKRHNLFLELVRSLKPVTWLRMPAAIDGVELKDAAEKRSTGALLFKGAMTTPPFKPGRAGSSLFLGGPATGAYAKIPNYKPAMNGQLTLSAWVRAESRPRWAAIAKHWNVKLSKDRSSYTGSGGQFHFGLHRDDGDLELQVRDSSGQIVRLREEVRLPLNEWHHVAFVLDGAFARVYRNGHEVASAECNGISVDGPPGMGIGVKLDGTCDNPSADNPGYWHGRIDELLIFHQALSSEQIRQLFKSLSKTSNQVSDPSLMPTLPH